VIVVFGNQIAMEESMEQSLQKIFGGKPTPAARPVPDSPAQVALDDKDLARRAWEHFQRAQESLKQGNWSGYGDELKKVEGLLKEMQKAPNK
jgi:uncharacterized membrane protein (UPF0182 family)